MGKLKKLKQIRIYEVKPKTIELHPKLNHLREYLDNYYEEYINKSTLIVLEAELPKGDKDLKIFTDEINMEKEQKIDKAILRLICDYKLPLIPKLIAYMKDYMAKKVGLNKITTFDDILNSGGCNCNPIISTKETHDSTLNTAISQGTATDISIEYVNELIKNI